MMCRFFSGDGKTQRVGKPAGEKKSWGFRKNNQIHLSSHPETFLEKMAKVHG